MATKLTYRIDMIHPNSMRRMETWRRKSLPAARKLTKEILKSWDADVTVYKNGRYAYKPNPEDFASGRD